MLEVCMSKWLDVAKKYPVMFEDSRYVEEGLLMVRFYHAIHQQNAKPIPDDYPLKSIWDSNSSLQLELEREFLLETRSRKF